MMKLFRNKNIKSNSLIKVTAIIVAAATLMTVMPPIRQMQQNTKI